MNLILLGAPGAGKGTQAVKIAEEYKIPHISTGDIFRKNIKEQTELGKLAKTYIDKGELVPDEVTIAIVADRLKASDCASGWLLDGFPRTVAQAEALAQIAKVDVVINIDIDLQLLKHRLTGRRVCGDCGESYHVDMLDGRMTCAKCKGALYQRDDDTEETVQSRLDVYQKQTSPLIAYYSEKKLLKNVNGNDSIENVFAEIKRILA